MRHDEQMLVVHRLLALDGQHALRTEHLVQHQVLAVQHARLRPEMVSTLHRIADIVEKEQTNKPISFTLIAPTILMMFAAEQMQQRRK